MKKRVPPSFVMIGQSQQDAKALLGVDSEIELVRKLVPATADRTTISGDAATRASALQALEVVLWAELCHSAMWQGKTGITRQMAEPPRQNVAELLHLQNRRRMYYMYHFGV